MDLLIQLQQSVLGGGELTRSDALHLAREDPEKLARAANEIRERIPGRAFDLCTIVNVKCGGCTEDCIYCAQSVHHSGSGSARSIEDITRHLPRITEHYSLGVNRCGCVTAGRTLTGEELDQMLEQYRKIQDTCEIPPCTSHGLLTEAQLCRLKGAGVVRYHSNLETSRRYFPQMCTTHI